MPFEDVAARGNAFTQDRTTERSVRRSAARYVIRNAQDAKDARLLLDVLGLSPEEVRDTVSEPQPNLLDLLGVTPDRFHIDWARTMRVGTAGSVTLTINLDVAKLTEGDRDFLRGIGELLRSVADIEPMTEEAR